MLQRTVKDADEPEGLHSVITFYALGLGLLWTGWIPNKDICMQNSTSKQAPGCTDGGGRSISGYLHPSKCGATVVYKRSIKAELTFAAVLRQVEMSEFLSVDTAPLTVPQILAVTTAGTLITPVFIWLLNDGAPAAEMERLFFLSAVYANTIGFPAGWLIPRLHKGAAHRGPAMKWLTLVAALIAASASGCLAGTQPVTTGSFVSRYSHARAIWFRAPGGVT
jgi:hypothetical protein